MTAGRFDAENLISRYHLRALADYMEDAVCHQLPSVFEIWRTPQATGDYVIYGIDLTSVPPDGVRFYHSGFESVTACITWLKQDLRNRWHMYSLDVQARELFLFREASEE